MRKTLFLTLSALVVAATPALAQTKDQAKAFVNSAVAFAKKNGRDALLAEVNKASGQFHFQKGRNNDLYIFVYDLNGVVLAHGVRAELVNQNRWTSKDPDGKPWIQDWTALVKKSGSGWIDYKEKNPAKGGAIQNKSSFVELFGGVPDGMVIGCGVYVD